jgi:HSP20 family molecular chaperone IbpA
MKYLMIILIIVSNQSFTQHPTDAEYQKEIKRFRQMRKKILNRMLKDFGEDDFFQDDMSDAFGMIDKMFKGQGAQSGQNQKYSDQKAVSYKWSKSESALTLTITLVDKDTPIDLDISGNMINIKGRIISKTQHESSVSSFANSVSIPSTVDVDKVEITNDKDKNILIVFPYKNVEIDQNVQPKPQLLKKTKKFKGEVSL